ncbi:MAG: TetR/AcrR family transcriptional regulator [bacterium]|nr:TetR/AcrR family transcriptional regulator [bacterium]
MSGTENNKPHPPGRVKIVKALRTLLETKDFSSIKIADIARTAGVTEPLIYKYFRDKRDLLHELLQEYLEKSFDIVINDLKDMHGSMNKLRHFISIYIQAYNIDRVIARVVLLEVSSSYDYYESNSYQTFKKYGQLIFSIIEEGVESGELRDDIPPLVMRHVILGGIDRSCLNPIIFNKPIDVEPLANDLSTLIFDAIRKK